MMSLTKEEIFHSSRQRMEKSLKRLCLVLILTAGLQMISGVIMGTIIAVLSFIPSNVIKLLQQPLPIYVPAAVVSVTGLCVVFCFIGIFFNISSFVFSLANLFSLVITALPVFTSFRYFRYHAEERVCLAFQNFPLSKSEGIPFSDLSDCSPIQFTIPPIMRMLVVIYSGSCVFSLTCFLLLSRSSCLTYQYMNDKYAMMQQRHQNASTEFFPSDEEQRSHDQNRAVGLEYGNQNRKEITILSTLEKDLLNYNVCTCRAKHLHNYSRSTLPHILTPTWCETTFPKQQQIFSIDQRGMQTCSRQHKYDFASFSEETPPCYQTTLNMDSSCDVSDSCGNLRAVSIRAKEKSWEISGIDAHNSDTKVAITDVKEEFEPQPSCNKPTTSIADLFQTSNPQKYQARYCEHEFPSQPPAYSDISHPDTSERQIPMSDNEHKLAFYHSEEETAF